MRKIFLFGAVPAFFAFASMGMATTCVVSNPGWTFQTLGSCGNDSSGVSFTNSDGQKITIFPATLVDGQVQSNSSYDFNPVDGLFEVQKGQNGNIASGIGPYVNGQGGSPFNGQGGIQDFSWFRSTVDYMLFIEVSNTGTGAIANGTLLNFLMQEGSDADTFNVWTLVNNSNSLPDLSDMTKVSSDVAVGVKNGGATVPQFSITTSTTSSLHTEWIAIEADCNYLLLNSITDPSPVPEPRFYGLLLASLIGLGIVIARNRKPAVNQ